MAGSHATHKLGGIVVFALIAMALYFAREICIPVALAGLLCFLLAPVASRLQRWHVPRVVASILVVLLFCGFVGSVGWMMTGQLMQLVDKMPEYQTVIHQKIKSLHAKPGGTLQRINDAIENLAEEVQSLPGGTSAGSQRGEPGHPGQNPSDNAGVAPSATSTQTPATDASSPAATSTAPATQAIEVKLARQNVTAVDLLKTAISRTFNPLLTLGIVLILTLFMLIQQDDLRDRAIRLMGHSQLHMTTRALDEAAARVSRYLLMQLIVNCVFGFCVWLGLAVIGIPFSPLWGLLAGTLRFMPYFGVPAAAVPPAFMAIVSNPGFMEVFLVAGLFVFLEITIAYFVEPWLYGSKTGISPLAILVSALFWAWLWGPAGLLLSTPLTVCLAVMGKHIAGLRFLQITLGDEPALTPAVRLYQRLLARDTGDAWEMVEKRFQDSSAVHVYDEMLLPAIVMAEHNRQRGELDEAQEHTVIAEATELAEDLEQLVSDGAAGKHDDAQPTATSGDPPATTELSGRVLCGGVSSLADDLGAHMLGNVLRGSGLEVHQASAQLLAAEFVKEALELHPQVICLSATTPHAALQARYLCKRLRAADPSWKLLVALWHPPKSQEKQLERFTPNLAEYVVTTLEEAAARVKTLAAVETHPAVHPMG